MTKLARALGTLCLGLMATGCQGIPGLGGLGNPDGNSPFSESGLVANNSAALSGQVLAPSSLVANNSAALVGNNSAALVSNNAAAYRTAAVRELPVIKAVVEAVRDGQVVSKATTDETGSYELSNLTKEKTYLLRVSFTLDNQKFQELAIAKTLTSSGNTINSATTLVTAKVLKEGTVLDRVNMAKYYDTVNLVAATQSSIDSAALTSTDQSASAFDQVGQSNQQVTDSFTETVSPTTTTSNPTPAPSQSPTTTYEPRAYFYPPSGTAEAQFLTTETKEYPKASGQPTQVSTSSFGVKVLNYTVSSATLRRTVAGIDFDSAISQSGGLVKFDNMTLGTPVFTPEGSTVTPLSAATTVRYSLVAANQGVSVPAGTYTCVQLLETTTATSGTSQRTMWYAPGLGLGPVKVLSTVTEATESGVATRSIETVLRSFKQ